MASRLTLVAVLVLWRTYGDCENYAVLNGHRGAVLDLNWSRDSRVVYTASADSLLASWDVEAVSRIRRYVGHEDIVNTMDITRRGPEMFVSGSDDGTIGVRMIGFEIGARVRLLTVNIDMGP